MKVFTFLLCLLVAFSEVSAQDWKIQYDQALKLYQEEKYVEALEASKRAYPLAKLQDTKSLAYTLQLLTATYLQITPAEEAISFSEEEVTLFLALEGERSKNYAEALKKQLTLLYANRKITEAAAKSEKTLLISKSVLGESSYGYAVLLSLAAQISIAANQFDTAKIQVTNGLALLEKIPEAGEDYLTTLSLAADLDRRMNNPLEAERKYKKLLAVLEQNGMHGDPIYADAKESLDQLLGSAGGVAGATELIANGTSDANLRSQSYLKLAIDYQQKGNVAKAFENYALAKRSVRESGLLDKTAFSILLNAVRYGLEKRRLDGVEADFVQLKICRDKLFTKTESEYLIAELTEADFLLESNEVTSALDLYKAVSVYMQQNSRLLPPSFLLHSAKRLLHVHQSVAALQLLKPLLDASGELKDQASIGILYCEALQQTGRNAEAISFLNDVISKSQNAEALVAYQLQVAEIQKASGYWNEALSTLSKIQMTAASGTLSSQLDFQKARLYQLLGQFREAEQFYRNALLKNETGGSIELHQQINNSFATFYTAVGNFEAAEKIYESLLADKNLDENFRITVFQNLATVYQQTLRYKEAENLLEQVVREDAQRLGDSDPDYALSLQNLASVYQRTGEYRKATELYSKALGIDAKTVGEESLPYATKAANLGIAQMELGDLAKAQEHLQQSLRTREKLLGKEHPDYVFNEYNLAVLYQRMQVPEKAMPLYKHVSTFYSKQIAELFPALSEKEKTAYFNKISEVIQAYMDFAVEQGAINPSLVADLLDFRLMTKALLLNSSTKIRNRILSGNDPVLKQQFTAWLQLKEELGKLYTQSAAIRSQNKSRIEELQNQVNEIEKNLSAKSELFAKSTEREVTNWQQLKATLKPEEVAIEMIRLRLNYKNDSIIYVALVIRSDWDQPKMIIFPNGKSMEGREFKYYRNATSFNVQNERSYKVYWKPLEAVVKNASRIYFSSDGVYSKINLASLFSTEKSSYLIDQYSFSLLSNLKELNGRGSKHITQAIATLVGSPNFGFASDANLGTSSVLRSMIGSDFQDLPGTKREIEKITSLLQEKQWKVNQFLEQDASEEKIKGITSAEILHIATHGFFIADGESTEHVIFSNNLEHAASNPLLRSGLILSGVGKQLSGKETTTEDGILTAYEAIALPLENTNLVILSACETGQGEIRNGEGVYGLQRAILMAGAHHLLMSLWKVDDEATQELMTEFYTEWLTTQNLSGAYRKAQLTIKEKYKTPHYWAGFVLVGIE